MLNFFKRKSSVDDKIAALEKRISILEKKTKKLMAESTSNKDKGAKTAENKTSQKKKSRKEAVFQERMNKTVEAVMAIKGWDREYTEEKFLATRKRTGCTPKEYVLYKLYDLTEAEQDTYYLATYQKILEAKYDVDKEFKAMLYDKERTNEYFSEYVRRPWCVNTKVSFVEFKDVFKNSNRVIYKPLGGHCGYGIKAYYIDADNIKQIYDELVTFPAGVVEEFIVQHPAMRSLSPSSVNSLRFVTLSSNSKAVSADGKKLDIPYSVVRIGRGDSIVDNLHSGGMVANVDMETGTLATDGADRDGNLFIAHPETGTIIKGFKIPFYNEALEMVREAIEKNGVEGYLGWDIAIGENGPMLIEVNVRPGADCLQTAYAQEKKGMKHVMEKYL